MKQLLLLASLFAAGCTTTIVSAPQHLMPANALGRFEPCNFTGTPTEAEVKDGVLTLPMGQPLSAVAWKGEPPQRDMYRLSYEARRIDGLDFFAACTFPVGQNSLTLVLGGWSGAVCGLSNIDDNDAAHNSTTRNDTLFENGRWYKIDIEVRQGLIEVFLDGKSFMKADTNGKKVDTRPEVERTKPLGFCSFESKSEIRKMMIQKLHD